MTAKGLASTGMADRLTVPLPVGTGIGKLA